MTIFRNSVPEAKPVDPIEWATKNVKVNGGKTSFDPALSPQTTEVIRAICLDPGLERGIYMKPVQTGGSVAGEVVAAWWASFESGLMFYLWEDDEKANDRWQDRIFPVFEKCGTIKRTGGRFEELIGVARYPNITIHNKGVFSESELDSDTVSHIIAEEVHSWKPGFLAKAFARQTRVWNRKFLGISNAGNEGDQLDTAYQSGTSEVWEVHCPKCGGWHEMRFDFNPNKPELGGLRWDSAGCKMENGRFDYNKLERTIRCQFPCGFEIKDHAAERRLLKGRYRVTNEGAHVSHRSWNFEGVSCDAIRWLSLIQEYHQAIRSLKSGDIEPMRRFTTERKCKPWSENHIPFQGQIVVSKGVVKQRDGMPNRVGRLWAADWQAGYKALGQLEHFWLVIVDVDADCNDLVVFEGRVDSENELIAELTAHDAIENGSGVVDCSFNTKHLLQFCYQNRLNAVMSNNSRSGGFRHKEDGVIRFYDEGQPICTKLNVPPVYEPENGEPQPHEPKIINVTKAGIIANHFFIREHETRVVASAKEKGREALPDEFIRCIVPEDVSEDYTAHLSSWQRVGKDNRRKNAEEVSNGVDKFQQLSGNDHMLLCKAYVDMLKDYCGLLGDRLTKLGIERTK